MPASALSTSWRITATRPAPPPIKPMASPLSSLCGLGSQRPWGGGGEGGAPGPRPLSALTATAFLSCLHTCWVHEAGPSKVARSRLQGSCSQGGLHRAPAQATTRHTQEPRAARVGHGSGGQQVTWLYQGLASLPAGQAKPISSSPEGATRARAWGGWAWGWAHGLPWLQTTQMPAWCPAGGAVLCVPQRLSPCHPSSGLHQHPPGPPEGPAPWGSPGLCRQVAGRTLDPEEEGAGGWDEQ